MAGKQNLIPASKRTSEEASENGRKGGIASGKARREKADMRRMAQSILDGTFTLKDEKGEVRELTGTEIMLKGLLKNIANANSRNWGKAMDIMKDLTGANLSPEQKAKIKAETQLAKAKAKEASGANVAPVVDDNFLQALSSTAADDWSDEGGGNENGDEDSDV